MERIEKTQEVSPAILFLALEDSSFTLIGVTSNINRSGLMSNYDLSLLNIMFVYSVIINYRFFRQFENYSEDNRFIVIKENIY